MQAEQEAYDYLKPRWSRYSDNAQALCEREARKNPLQIGNYLALSVCARGQAETIPHADFRR